MSQPLLKSGIMSFAELETALNAIPNQTDGDPCGVSNIGELYLEFLSAMPARPGDEKIVERHVVADMVRRLNDYFQGKSGRLYWRVRLETEIKPHPMVLRLDANGPDIDFLTNAPCVMDNNWVRVAAYCRLVRARCPTMERQDRREAAAAVKKFQADAAA